MSGFEDVHRDRIVGTLAMFDRVIFRGHLTRLFTPGGMRIFLWSQGVQLTRFATWAKQATNSVCDRALVAFWVSTGARASELLGVTAGDIDPGQQLITVMRKGTRVLQPLPAAPDAFVWLRLYHAQLSGLVPAGRDEPLWCRPAIAAGPRTTIRAARAARVRSVPPRTSSAQLRVVDRCAWPSTHCTSVSGISGSRAIRHAAVWRRSCSDHLASAPARNCEAHWCTPGRRPRRRSCVRKVPARRRPSGPVRRRSVPASAHDRREPGFGHAIDVLSNGDVRESGEDRCLQLRRHSADGAAVRRVVARVVDDRRDVVHGEHVHWIVQRDEVVLGDRGVRREMATASIAPPFSEVTVTIPRADVATNLPNVTLRTGFSGERIRSSLERGWTTDHQVACHRSELTDRRQDPLGAPQGRGTRAYRDGSNPILRWLPGVSAAQQHLRRLDREDRAERRLLRGFGGATSPSEVVVLRAYDGSAGFGCAPCETRLGRPR